VKEGDKLTSVYQQSAAELNSLDLAWTLLMDERFTALRRQIYSTEDEFLRFRQVMVNLVLATDIMDKDLNGLRKARWEKAFGDESISESESEIDKNRKATIVLEHLIQASDVAHTMQHWMVYVKWNERFFMECMAAFKQGRADKDPSLNWYQGYVLLYFFCLCVCLLLLLLLQLLSMMLMMHILIHDFFTFFSEIGFFDFYIIPLAKKLKECGVFGVSSAEYLRYAEQNRKEWELRGHDIVEGFIAKFNESDQNSNINRGAVTAEAAAAVSTPTPTPAVMKRPVQQRRRSRVS
jgi:hypothetical protein